MTTGKLKLIIFGIIAVIVVVVGTAFLLAKPAVNDLALRGLADKGIDVQSLPLPDQVVTANPRDQMVVLDAIVDNQSISSPLVITGQARGLMFFEASFPIELLSADGQVLGTTIAQAKTEWMTEDFVPFEATLIFQAQPGEAVTLVLKKDNPSGDPIRDASFTWPLQVK